MQSILRQFTSATLTGSSLCSSTNRSSFILPFIFEIQQQRGRKRALKAPLSKAQRMEKRLKREAKEAARKQYSFMERNIMRRMKSLMSPSKQFPGRYIAEEESKLPDRPTTNVYIKGMVKTQFYPIEKALNFHREMQQPMIYNNPNAPVRIRFELNMNTEKATKMVPNSEEIVPIPHVFKHTEKRAILALVKDQKLQELAVENGAEIALGPDVVKKIIKGQFRTEDYDFCIAHTDMASFIAPLRGVLKARFPTKLNGGLGDDIPEILERFKNGVKLSIRGDTVYPIWGLCDCVVGRLSMSDEQLEANIAAVIESLTRHRNPALGPFINRALMMVMPGDAHFPIDIQKYLPIPTEEEIEKIEKHKGGKKKKKEVQEEEAEQAASGIPT